MTVAFLATGCTLADMAAITGVCEEEVAERITRTWDGDALGRIYGLAHATYHDRIAETFASSDDLDEPWGDWCAPWWRKPVSYADLDAFFESNGCGWLRQSIGIGSWRGDAGEDEKAARIIRASLEQHGLTLERARARYGKRRVSEARKWAETVAFFATGCSFLDIAEVVDRSVAQVSKEIYDTWCKDYYIGCVDNICKLAFDGYLVREQGLDEDGVEPGEVIVLEEYMDGETQELRSLGTSDVHGV